MTARVWGNRELFGAMESLGRDERERVTSTYYKDEGIIILTLQRVGGNGFLVLVSLVYSYGPPGNKFMVLLLLACSLPIPSSQSSFVLLSSPWTFSHQLITFYKALPRSIGRVLLVELTESNCRKLWQVL